MTLKKYSATLSIVISSVLMTMSCEDSNIVVKPTNSANTNSQTKSAGIGARIMNYTFDGTEGGAISLTTASRWVTNYLNQKPQGAKSYFFGAAVLKKILSSDGSMGIRIYYSLDDNGNKQLLLIGADVNGNDLMPAGIKGQVSTTDLSASNSSDVISDTDGVLIADDITQRWKSNYIAKNPSSLIAHFFGFEILNQILSQPGCIGLRMYYALNDSGVQQILLVGVDGKGNNILPTQAGGRVTDGSGTIGDISLPCPGYC